MMRWLRARPFMMLRKSFSTAATNLAKPTNTLAKASANALENVHDPKKKAAAKEFETANSAHSAASIAAAVLDRVNSTFSDSRMIKQSSTLSLSCAQIAVVRQTLFANPTLCDKILELNKSKADIASCANDIRSASGSADLHQVADSDLIALAKMICQARINNNPLQTSDTFLHILKIGASNALSPFEEITKYAKSKQISHEKIRTFWQSIVSPILNADLDAIRSACVDADALANVHADNVIMARVHVLERAVAQLQATVSTDDHDPIVSTEDLTPYAVAVQFFADQADLFVHESETQESNRFKYNPDRIPQTLKRQTVSLQKRKQVTTVQRIVLPWTLEEDEMLFYSVSANDFNFAKVALDLPGRTVAEVSGRYYGHIVWLQRGSVLQKAMNTALADMNPIKHVSKKPRTSHGMTAFEYDFDQMLKVSRRNFSDWTPQDDQTLINALKEHADELSRRKIWSQIKRKYFPHFDTRKIKRRAVAIAQMIERNDGDLYNDASESDKSEQSVFDLMSLETNSMINYSKGNPSTVDLHAALEDQQSSLSIKSNVRRKSRATILQVVDDLYEIRLKKTGKQAPHTTQTTKLMEKVTEQTPALKLVAANATETALVVDWVPDPIVDPRNIFPHDHMRLVSRRIMEFGRLYFFMPLAKTDFRGVLVGDLMGAWSRCEPLNHPRKIWTCADDIELLKAMHSAFEYAFTGSSSSYKNKLQKDGEDPAALLVTNKARLVAKNSLRYPYGMSYGSVARLHFGLTKTYTEVKFRWMYCVYLWAEGTSGLEKAIERIKRFHGESESESTTTTSSAASTASTYADSCQAPVDASPPSTYELIDSNETPLTPEYILYKIRSNDWTPAIDKHLESVVAKVKTPGGFIDWLSVFDIMVSGTGDQESLIRMRMVDECKRRFTMLREMRGENNPLLRWRMERHNQRSWGGRDPRGTKQSEKDLNVILYMYLMTKCQSK